VTSTPRSERGIGPLVRPSWWDFLRQVIMFGLGLALIIDAAVTPNGRSSLIITGLVLLGLIPLDTWLTREGP
jgi:hypothetical protein